MSDAPQSSLVESVRQALRTVIDPELGYNIFDLGLIYEANVDAACVAHILMTTTTRGCPATGYLQEGARESVSRVPGIAATEVVLTYEPAWSPQKMTAEAKRDFGIGIESESVP